MEKVYASQFDTRPPAQSRVSSPRQQTQSDRILALLIAGKGGEVPLPEIIACAAQYHARLLELRRLGWRIRNGKRTTPHLVSAGIHTRPSADV